MSDVVVSRRYPTVSAARADYRALRAFGLASALNGASAYLSSDEDSPHGFVTLVGRDSHVEQLAAKLAGEPFELPPDVARSMLERRDLARAGPLGDADRVDARYEKGRTVVEHGYDPPRKLGEDGRMR